MIYYNNLAQTKEAIQQYVEAGDYSRPHIVAVQMFCPELEIFISENKTIPSGKELRYYSWIAPSYEGLAETVKQHPDNFFVVKFGCKDLTHQEELDSILSQPIDASRPWFIYIEHSKIREWIENIHCECDINVYAFDKEEWLKNCEAINPATGRRVIDRFYLDFLKQAPDDFILFYPQEKHSGMTCNIPVKWESANSQLFIELRELLKVAAKANGNKDKKREEIVQMVKPILDSVFVDGDIDWNKLAAVLDAIPDEVWNGSRNIVSRRIRETGLSRVDCFKLHAVTCVNCVTPNVYDALLEFHGLPALP